MTNQRAFVAHFSRPGGLVPIPLELFSPLFTLIWGISKRSLQSDRANWGWRRTEFALVFTFLPPRSTKTFNWDRNFVKSFLRHLNLNFTGSLPVDFAYLITTNWFSTMLAAQQINKPVPMKWYLSKAGSTFAVRVFFGTHFRKYIMIFGTNRSWLCAVRYLPVLCESVGGFVARPNYHLNAAGRGQVGAQPRWNAKLCWPLLGKWEVTFKGDI